ncbi:MAG TPA: hypothetical protein V6C52_01460 [Coleofasciculaceae cyanobacterium]|jgi:hypothetical protein
MESTPSFIYPDRPIYRAAAGYYNAFPYVRGLTDAMLTPGNRVTRFNAGADGLVYGFTFRELNKRYHRVINRLYDKHPRFAELMNRHPILLGLPIASLGFLIAESGGLFGQGLFRRLRETSTAQSFIHRALHSPAGDAVAKTLRPVAKFISRPAVLKTLGLALVGFGVVELFRIIQDRFSFGKAYKKIRQDVPYNALSPYALRNGIIESRMGPYRHSLPDATATVYPERAPMYSTQPNLSRLA